MRDITTFFREYDFTQDEIEAFMKATAFIAEDYPSLKSDALKRAKIKDDLRNFIVFLDKPIFRYENLFICLNPNFLALKFVEGPYRIVEAALKGTSREKMLADTWGRVYEAYVNSRLASAFKDTRPNLKTKNSELDALVLSGKYAFLVESKFAHWTFAARISGSRVDVKKYLGKIARFKPWKPRPGEPLSNKKLGLGQIKQFYLDIANELKKYDLEGKTIVPILVLGDDFPIDPANRKYLIDYVVTQDCLLKIEKALPFILLNSREVELIECIAEELGEERAANLIAEYAQSFRSAHIAFPTSFYSYCRATTQPIKSNKFILGEFERLIKRTMEHVKPAYRD